MTPVAWQRIEGALIVLGALPLAVMTQNGWPWWVWPLALLAPDLGAAGYLANRRIGAFTYNVTHLYGTGLLLALIGVALGLTGLIAAGAIWMVHVGADRAFGMGLKRISGFVDTHLGQLGEAGSEKS
ncbi:DUF4260 domain-containing protein [Paracoccus sp. JM45]|uniref:DUF4260 domain-containing protein n=1 Tax=Paracoccus sp. JM45 TaxID=2283626 RepID=UPI000E6CCEFE|nr:DUF4260 domain-containing protein [Paracoccus sp. JM45]RJE81510.1 DUF4260 family protein [Paracoccus sp. JM45]